MTRVPKVLALFFMSGALLDRPAAIAQPASAMLVVHVGQVRSIGGSVHVDICTVGQFLKTCSHSGAAPAVVGTTDVVIRNLSPGRYAAQVFHDKNGNGEVDRKIFGIPTEGIGFSNDARISFGPPKFTDAAFDYGGGVQSIALKLRYF